MKWLKHILLMVTLLIAAMPHFHAHELIGHTHDASARADLSASHTCECHACDEAPCADGFEMPQESVSGSITVPEAPVSLQQVVFTKPGPVVYRAPLTVSGTLARIQTIQLLI